jgi:hypothetical protein
MKYFSSLPKRTFSSTVGDFTICDFFTRYEVNYDTALTQDALLDNHSTLIELSRTIYKDNNSIWLLLLANEYTDPFSLAEINTTVYKNNNAEKVSTAFRQKAYVSAAPTVIGTSAIIVPYSANTGSSWSYSSIGNFNLDGPFTLIESTDYYTGKSVLKDQQKQIFISTGTTSGSETLICIDKPLEEDYSIIADQLTTTQKESFINEVSAYEFPEVGAEIEGGQPAYKTTSFTPLPPSAFTGVTQYTTNLDYIKSTNKNLKVFIPSQLSKILSNLITFG